MTEDKHFYLASVKEVFDHNNEGFTDTATVLQEESNVKLNVQKFNQTHMKRMKNAILEGDWLEAERLCLKLKSVVKNHKSFLYALYKQGYLELLERQEYQKAFAYLTKLLKPLESRQPDPDDFKDLCYLLTCKSLQDSPTFKNWEGGGKEGRSRQKLVEQFQSLLEFDSTGPVRVPPNRLVELLRQAVTYQIETNTSHMKVAPKIKTLFEDFKGINVPNSRKVTFVGHKDNVKCIEFVGHEDGRYIASGSSDNTIKIWQVSNGECLATLQGHSSRVWDVSSTRTGKMLASASGDATIKLWLMRSEKEVDCIHTLKSHSGDVYTVRFHPGQNHIVTGGYDKTVRLFDVRTGLLKKSFVGHNSSVSRAIFNPSGNVVISGSKDSTIKFWDILSGLCIKTISSHLGEVTSVEINSLGSLLLSGSKDNSNRLWDLRTTRPVRRFKGHQNTSKNFVRACFGPNEELVVGGSEDGTIYIWEIGSGNIVQQLNGHTGMVYTTLWNQQQSLLASCSHDGTVALWSAE